MMKIRQRVVEHLKGCHGEYMTTMDLAVLLDASHSGVTIALAELRARKLVEVVDRTRRGTAYRLTDPSVDPRLV